MLILNLLFSIALGIVLAILFTAGFAQGTRPFSTPWWADVLGFFMLVFVATWAAGVWLPPRALGIGVLVPIAAAGVIAVVFFLASKRRKLAPITAGATALRASIIMQSSVFIVVMFLLAALVIAGYWAVNATT